MGITLRKTKMQTEMRLESSDLKWEAREGEYYPFEVTLHHLPSGEIVKQASETSLVQAKRLCLRELQARLCTPAAAPRYCEYCDKLIIGGGKKRKFCGRPCQNVARKMKNKMALA